MEKIEEMINNKIIWDKLMMIDYQLGIEIIAKAFLNSLLSEPGRKKWLGIFKKYSPVSANNIQVNISENNNLFIKFQRLSQSIFGSDAFELYINIFRKYSKVILYLQTAKHHQLQTILELLK